jgi:hypothetical protein
MEFLEVKKKCWEENFFNLDVNKSNSVHTGDVQINWAVKSVGSYKSRAGK